MPLFLLLGGAAAFCALAVVADELDCAEKAERKKQDAVKKRVQRSVDKELQNVHNLHQDLDVSHQKELAEALKKRKQRLMK